MKFLFLFVCSSLAYASEVDFNFLRSRALITSKSTAELDRRLSQLDKYRTDKQICHEQLQMATLPARCFDVIETERRLGVLTVAQYRDSQRNLDKICKDDVKSLNQLTDLRFKALKKQNLSPNCRKNLLAQYEKLKYKALDNDRFNLFELRIK